MYRNNHVASEATRELEQLIARCNPSAPSAIGDRIERIPCITPRLRAQILPSESSRALLLGQSGVGKTTELVQLEQKLKSHFCVLRPPLDRILDLRHLTWPEILVFTVIWASESQTIRGIDREMTTLCRKLAIPAAGAPPTPVQYFRNAPVVVRKRIDAGRAQFWDLARSALLAIERQNGKSIVLLLDGLEKMPDNAARRLFHDDGWFLERLPCRAVVTAPLSLSFQPCFRQIEAHFPCPAERLRALSYRPGEPGFAFFRGLAGRRGASSWMSQQTLDKAVHWGGGLPRQFLQLLASAAAQALADGSRIEDETLMRGAMRLIDRRKYQLDSWDCDELQKDDSQRSFTARSRLLRLGALLEYDQPDGSLRLEVNPLVQTFLDTTRGKSRRASG